MVSSRGERGDAPTWEECTEILDRLPRLPAEQRTGAILHLLRNPAPGIRQRALQMGAALLSEETAVALLREEADDILRNAGLEVLKRKGQAAFSAACGLLADPDDDVVLQAVLILDHLRDPRALEPMRPLLRHGDPNVVQAAITAVGHLGDARAVPDLLPFLQGDPWLQMAAVQALGDLRCKSSARALAHLLGDLMVGPIACEALARVGGSSAFRALAAHWLALHDELEPESILGLLAHVAQGLPAHPREVPGLRESIIPALFGEGDHGRLAAAHCLLSLGPGEGDAKALEVLGELGANSADLPSCLLRRSDLLPALLRSGGLLGVWGIRLGTLYPREVSLEDLDFALSQPEVPGAVDHVAEFFEAMKGREVGALLLRVYLGLPPADRPSLTEALEVHAGKVRRALGGVEGLDAAAAAVLHILLGCDEAEGVAALEALPMEERTAAVAQLLQNRALMEALPWTRWLAEDPEMVLPVACDAAVQAGVRGLMPELRRILEERPSPDVVRAAGETGDRGSVPLLVAHLEHADPLMRATLIESLGQIGGPEARRALCEVAGDARSPDARNVYRALAHAAVEEDAPLFRGAATHPDWVVRLACAEVLGRFPGPENLSALATLASDPSPVVAQRARALLDS